jgi:DNA-binding CsgD family transcriptional regulator
MAGNWLSQVGTGKRRSYRPNRTLSSVERSQLATQYGIGISALALARQYGIHRHAVVKHLKRDGVVVRGGQVKMTPAAIDRAKQLYADGHSLAAIGDQLGVDASTVHKALKRAGVDARYPRAGRPRRSKGGPPVHTSGRGAVIGQSTGIYQDRPCD